LDCIYYLAYCPVANKNAFFVLILEATSACGFAVLRIATLASLASPFACALFLYLPILD